MCIVYNLPTVAVKNETTYFNIIVEFESIRASFLKTERRAEGM